MCKKTEEHRSNTFTQLGMIPKTLLHPLAALLLYSYIHLSLCLFLIFPLRHRIGGTKLGISHAPTGGFPSSLARDHVSSPYGQQFMPCLLCGTRGDKTINFFFFSKITSLLLLLFHSCITGSCRATARI